MKPLQNAFRDWQSEMAYPCFAMRGYGFKFEIKLNILATAVMLVNIFTRFYIGM